MDDVSWISTPLHRLTDTGDNTSNMSPCPRHIENCNATDIDWCRQNQCVSYDIGLGPSYVAIVSSSFSCLGSLLILTAFIVFKDIRSGMAQRIITALAVADFVSAAGYIGGSINYLVFFNKSDKDTCNVFQGLCRAQAFVTSWSSMSSFAWTATLAFYFYLVLVYQKRPFKSKIQQILLHVFAWLAPLLIVIPFTALSYLGYAPYAASNWCFVADPNVYKRATFDDKTDLLKSTAKVLAAGKLWEILTYAIVIFVYSHIAFVLAKIRRNNYEEVRPERGRVERKMIYIPVIFLVLRIWGTTQFFLNIAMESTHPNHIGCILRGFHTANVVLGYLQAIGDPGQGWGNAILYVFMSDTIRKRMFTSPLKKCFRKAGRRLVTLGLDSDDNDENERDQEPEARPHRQIQGAQGDGDESRNQACPTPNQITSRRRIKRYDTLSTISCGDISQPGPIDEARPGPGASPVNVVGIGGAQQRRVLYPLNSETTTTTTTAVVHV